MSEEWAAEDGAMLSAMRQASLDSEKKKLAATLSEEVRAIDGVLMEALANPREKMQLLKLERDLVLLVKAAETPHLDFEGLSGYRRLLLHKLAERFGLASVSLSSTVLRVGKSPAMAPCSVVQ